jgi:hypothetical protein
MQELRKAGESLKKDTESIGSDLKDAAQSLTPARDSHAIPGKTDLEAAQKKTE